MASSTPPFFSLTIIFFNFFLQLVSAQKSTISFPSDNTSLGWINSNSSSNIYSYPFPQHQEVRVILRTNATAKVYGDHFSFVLAFYCNHRLTSQCLLAVMLLESTKYKIQIVWMANRNHLVYDNASLRAEPGGLALRDFDGAYVWSTNISGSPVGSMTLKGDGNLVLRSKNGSSRWGSFDHHCNTLVMGQVFGGHSKLRSTVSSINYGEGRFYVMLNSSALAGFVHYKTPVEYLRIAPYTPSNKTAKSTHIVFQSGNITFVYKDGNNYSYSAMATTSLAPIQLMKLEPDGSLSIHVWDGAHGWSVVPIVQNIDDGCQVPLLCGHYGLCARAKCSCPKGSDGSEYFTPHMNTPSRGCDFLGHKSTHISTHSYSQLVDFGNLSYFSYMDHGAAIEGLTELGACNQRCNENSTCKAAFFTYDSNPSRGLCYLLTEVLTIRGNKLKYGLQYTVASIKVPILPESIPPRSAIATDENDFSLSSPTGKALTSSFSLVIFVMLLLAIWWCKRRMYRRKDCFEQMLGAPVRYAFKDLWLATEKLSRKVGKGGNGTVFKGELKDGTPIAVKRLDHVDPRMDEFVAEMRTMSNIHHLNLVKLLGFCADESHKLLVYEYMSNGSLDQWIFSGERRKELNWEMRRRILLDVARGLAYLHEECTQRIAHLDMKPHNILLDEDFNAKISDFGLARFIDRNQSLLFTGMKGTPGYLAPEWKDEKITVKADIYSFGIVVLEAVSGRMNIDCQQEDSEVRLLGILKRKATEDRLIDIVDKKIEGWEDYEEDIVNMIRIGAWCLNTDPEKRPPMSTVVKILEGTMEIDETNIEFKFSHTLVLTCESSYDTSHKSSLSNRIDISEQL